jgi:hypothetical protein
MLYRELVVQQPDAFRSDLASSLSNLAGRLLVLGRNFLALSMAEEASALFRELAAQHPAEFCPDLAKCLAMRAICFDAVGRPIHALTSNVEAIRALYPVFIEHPVVFAHNMIPMVRQYWQRCEQLGREPDMQLLRPIIRLLENQNLSSGECPE